MTKKELVDSIYTTTGIEKAAIIAIIEELMVVIKESLSNNDSVYLRSFGTFGIRVKVAHYQNIKQGTERLFVPERKEPFFKPSKEFKEQPKFQLQVQH